MTVRESPNGNGITNAILHSTRKELDSINCATLFENRKSLYVTDRELFLCGDLQPPFSEGYVRCVFLGEKNNLLTLFE